VIARGDIDRPAIIHRPTRGSGGRVPEEANSEAHVPAEQPPSRQASRLPAPHEHPGRTGRGAGASAQGPRPPVGLIWRITDRATFAALRRDGRRARRGPVTVTYLAAPDGRVRAAFSIGRRVGSAVERNRVRRRLRAVLRELDGATTAGLPGGSYLLSAGAGAGQLPYAELRTATASAVDAATKDVQA
jgi:ribonuclease P protein component